jgi:hypothetical protein
MAKAGAVTYNTRRRPLSFAAPLGVRPVPLHEFEIGSFRRNDGGGVFRVRLRPADLVAELRKTPFPARGCFRTGRLRPTPAATPRPGPPPRLRSEPALAGVLLVALTGFGQEDDRRVLEAGFDHFLVKSVEAQTLDGLLGALPAGQPGGGRAREASR